MFQFTVASENKDALYRDVLAAIEAVTKGEPDPIANMANAAAILWEYLPDLNWVGFYRMIDGELVLGPFQGKVACIRIAVGQGVCGAAAAKGHTQLVGDVHAFPGHIACDAESQSEIVIPVIVDGQVVAVLDLDSPQLFRFDSTDAAGLEAIVHTLAPRIWPKTRQI